MNKDYEFRIYYKDNKYFLKNKKEDLCCFKDEGLDVLASIVAKEILKNDFDTDLPENKLLPLYDALMKYNK